MSPHNTDSQGWETPWTGPAQRRAVADLAWRLWKGRVVVLIGAGVDNALTGRPTWAGLLSTIDTCRTHATTRALTAVADLFPVEVAEAIRLDLGPEQYYKGVQQAIDLLPVDDKNPMRTGLRNLVSAGARTFVTFNYSRDLIQALEGVTSDGVQVIEAGHLSAWSTDDLFPARAASVRVIAIHGLVTYGGAGAAKSLVLDRRSYDATGPHYGDLLRRIFAERSTFGVGLSYTDVPLREAAAAALRLHPVTCPDHYACRATSGNREEDDWTLRAWLSAYNVRPIFCQDVNAVPSLLEEIASLAQQFDKAAPSAARATGRAPGGAAGVSATNDWQLTLAKYADFLDRTGDFESIAHRAWAKDLFAGADERRWMELRGWIEKQASECVSLDEWLVLARLERHLRHFLWIWKGEKGRDARLRLWTTIAAAEKPAWQGTLREMLKAFGEGGRKDHNVRGVFEFAYGAYDTVAWAKEAREANSLASRWRDRLDGVRRLSPCLPWLKQWANGESPEIDSAVILAWRSAHWESLVAWAILRRGRDDLLGKLTPLAKESSPRRLPVSNREALASQFDHARGLAQIAGNPRRRMAATILQSMVMEASEAERELIAVFASRCRVDEGPLDPILDLALLVGLVATYLDRDYDEPPLDVWLTERIGSARWRELPREAIQRLLDKPEKGAAEEVHAFHPAAAEEAWRFCGGRSGQSPREKVPP